jgi:hypothetical protein
MKTIIFLMVLVLQVPKSFLKAQVFMGTSRWYIVTETIFKGYTKLDTNKIFINDRRAGDTKPILASPDAFALDSFAGYVYVIKPDLIFHWINLGMKTREEIIALKKQQVSGPNSKQLFKDNKFSDGEISKSNGKDNGQLKDFKIKPSQLSIQASSPLLDLIKKFGAVFTIKPPWAIDENSKKELARWMGFRIDVKKKIIVCDKTDLVLKDERTGQEYFIEDSRKNFASLWCFLRCVYEYDVEQGLLKFLYYNDKTGGIAENEKFLSHYFNLMLNDLPKAYPKFSPVPSGWYRGAEEVMNKKDWCVTNDDPKGQNLHERKVKVE